MDTEKASLLTRSLAEACKACNCILADVQAHLSPDEFKEFRHLAGSFMGNCYLSIVLPVGDVQRFQDLISALPSVKAMSNRTATLQKMTEFCANIAGLIEMYKLDLAQLEADGRCPNGSVEEVMQSIRKIEEFCARVSRG